MNSILVVRVAPGLRTVTPGRPDWSP